MRAVWPLRARAEEAAKIGGQIQGTHRSRRPKWARTALALAAPGGCRNQDKVLLPPAPTSKTA